jgi:nitrate reductase cytochrome c-type subunit
VTITQATANVICNQCHTTGGAYAAQATRDIVTAHYGSKHDNTTRNSGYFCWDCHEPHGDANDYMIQATVASRTDMSTAPGGIGIPLATSAVSFLKSGGDNATAYDWGDYVGTVFGNTDRLCRVCHDSTVNHFNTSTWNSAHNPGARCTSCHGDTYKHDINFRGIGTCVGCHDGAQGSSPVRRQVTGAAGQFLSATHHVTGTAAYLDNTADGAGMNIDCSKCHWEGYLTGDTILSGRTPAKQGDTNPAFHWADDGNNATAKFVQARVWSGTTAPIAYSNTAGTGSAIEWRNATTYDPVVNAINLNRHCLGCHSASIVAATPFSDGRSPRVRSWDGIDIGTKYLRNGAANTVNAHSYDNTTYNVVPRLNKALSPHFDLQNNRRGVATTGAWVSDDAATLSNTATGTVACFDCHNSHGSPVVGTATLPLVSYANNATLNAGLTNANVGGLLKATTAGVSGYTTTYMPVDNTTWNWGKGSAMCFDCHVGSTMGGTPPKTYTAYGRTAAQIVAGYYDPVDWRNGASAGQGVWDNRRWSGSFAFKTNNIVVTHFKNDAVIRPLQTVPTTQLNGLCSRCHDPHGVTTNTTKVADANYGVPALKGQWMTSPYLEDRPGNKNSSAPASASFYYNDTSNVWNFNGCTTRFGPRAVPFRNYNKPAITGGGYGTTGGGGGHDGFFIDENTFGLHFIQNATNNWQVFANNNLYTYGGNNARNLWQYGSASMPYPANIVINHITQNNTQFAGLCEQCHSRAALLGTVSKLGGTITRVHNSVRNYNGAAFADIFPRNFAVNTATGGLNGNRTQQVIGAYSGTPSDVETRFVEAPSRPWDGFIFSWGLNLNDTGGQALAGYTQSGYHQFPCSKCHTPHTSRLPRLMKTNCLDTGTVSTFTQRHSTNGDGTSPSANTNFIRFRATVSNNGAAWNPARTVHCHNNQDLIGLYANDTRWNDITPW